MLQDPRGLAIDKVNAGVDLILVIANVAGSSRIFAYLKEADPAAIEV